MGGVTGGVVGGVVGGIGTVLQTEPKRVLICVCRIWLVTVTGTWI